MTTLLFWQGCRYPLDGLYALPLDREPTAEDWRRVPPYSVEVVGGRTSVAKESDVDADAVHVTTASCHHGADAPPVTVALRAFWTRENLYLQLRWEDPTENRGPVWSWTDAGWRAAARWEDGLGVLWGGEGEALECARYCHLADWRVAGQRALADYAMVTPQGIAARDFWVWRPGRGSVDGEVEDSWLGPEGRRADGAGAAGVATYRPNSVRATAGGLAFEVGDAPRIFPAPGPGAKAPAYVRATAQAAAAEVGATSRWADGGWSVVLFRSLASFDPEDVHFRPGGEYSFGLAVLDAVERDHLAATETISLRLLTPAEVAKAEGAWGSDEERK